MIGRDVAVGVGAELVGLAVEHVQLGDTRVQRRTPVGTLAGIEVEGDLDHTFPVEFPPRHVDQQVGKAGRPGVLPASRLHVLRRRRQFEHETRIEPIQRLESEVGNRPVPLVNHDHRSDDPQRITRRVLHHGEHPLIAVEVRRPIQRFRVRLLLTLGREKAVNVAPVAEDLQGFLVFLVRRLQHQEHDAQVGFHVPSVPTDPSFP